MKKRILYITALTAIIAPIFLTGTINPFICIYIHLFGIILFVFRANRELRLMFVLLFLWFDFFFWNTDDVKIYKYSYYNSLFKTNRYHWGERTEAGDGNYGPVIYDV
ncbi:MAG: hypothetical protein PHF41_11935, partial [Massilibacteroides sp.]|nr:hypothetical protein [Massilibacteroides sp.]